MVADLVISQTAERLDFTLANLTHYVVADSASPDGWGTHFDFGRDGVGVDNAQTLVDCMYAIREYNRALGVSPSNDPGAPVGPVCTNKRAILFHDTQLLRISICGCPIDFEPHPQGVPGGWITRFNEHIVCSQNSPQQFADLADAIVVWARINLGLTPTTAVLDGE